MELKHYNHVQIRKTSNLAVLLQSDPSFPAKRRQLTACTEYWVIFLTQVLFDLSSKACAHLGER